jgi:capsid assembly protease
VPSTRDILGPGARAGAGYAAEAKLASRPWALRAEVLHSLAGALAAGPHAEPKRNSSRRQKQVAIISLKGLIMPDAGALAALFGAEEGGLQAFRSMVGEASADPDTASIILEVDSPGGSTDLVTEAAADVAKARERKPVTAVANAEMGSAAYWIASQADEIVVTPSGQAGSIGVFAIHFDESRALDDLGVTPTIISAGKYKTEGNPIEPLSESAEAYAQSVVDTYYASFVEDVAAGRGVPPKTVRDGYGQGRMLPAEAAVEAGLADRVAPIEEVLDDHLTAAAAGRPAMASARSATSTDRQGRPGEDQRANPLSRGEKSEITAEALRALAASATREQKG